MSTIRQSAESYESKTTKNIAELKEVSTELDVKEVEYMDKNGEPFTLNIVEIDGEQYRVPASVLKQLKEILSEKPATTKFKVKKSGEGMSTSYTVVPLD